MPNNRVTEVDLLRFLAALAVVFFHYSFRGYAADGMSIMPYPLLASVSKYGYLGVQLFFMISGFVILMTASSGAGLRGFVVSRIIRLYPAFWVCCTITFLVTLFIGGSLYVVSLGQYLTNMTLLSGFLGVASVDGAYWSLFVEIQFYALVAIVLILKKIHRAELFINAWLLLTILLEIIPVGKLRYLFIVDYSAFFISGAMFFLIWSKGFSIGRFSTIFLSWIVAVSGSVESLAHFENHYNVTMSRYVVVGIVTVFFFSMFLISMHLTGFVGRCNWLAIGALTYPLYLLHQNIGFMIFNVGYPRFGNHLLLWGSLALILYTTYLINVYVERRYAPRLKKAVNIYFDYLDELKRKWISVR